MLGLDALSLALLALFRSFIIFPPQETKDDLKPLVLGLGALSLLLLALVLLLLLCLHKHRREVNGDTKKVWNLILL